MSKIENLKDVRNRLETFKGNYMGKPFSEVDLVRYTDRGGIVVSDSIMSVDDFLSTYVVVEGGVAKIRKRYALEFNSMRTFIASNRVEGQVFRSFFGTEFIRVIYMFQISTSEEQEVVFGLDESREEEVKFDFLNCYDQDDIVYYTKEVPDSYFDRIKKDFTIDELVRKYRYYLTTKNLSTQVSTMKYDNPLEFVSTYDRQYGLYYEVLYKLKRKIPNLKLYIPHDGLGALSMMCIVMGIAYRSNEPYGIGEIACRLGIITSSSVFFSRPEDDEIIVLANLEEYLAGFINTFDKKRTVIIAENRLFEGCVLEDVKISTHGRVHTPLLEDDFITGGQDISKSTPMLQKYNNIPLNAKAEFFLIESGLDVCTDGAIETVTKAKVVDGNARYIVTTDKIKEYSNITFALESKPILNIVNRNEPLLHDVGKNGDVKVYNDQYFTFVGDRVELAGPDFYDNVKLKRYNDPHELRDWYKDGYFIVGIKCANPRAKYYIVELGQKQSIVYLSSITSRKGLRMHFFQYKIDVQMYSRVVERVIEEG